MKILFYQDLPSINSTLLTWTLCEELRLLGHTVHYGKQPLLLHYDWVWGYGQDSWGAIKMAKKLDAKCHIHLEGVAYWRVDKDNAIDWGYDQNHSSKEIEAYRKHYKSWMSAAYGADSCSVNGKNQVKTIEEYLFEDKKLPNCHIISCGADARYAMTLPDYKQENYMVTASRLEPNKKVFMIAEALVLLKKQRVDVPLWIIVGYGTQRQVQRLANILNPANISCRIIPCFGAEKWLWIKRAKIMLCGWMAIPMSEGLLCNIPVLSFDHPDMVEMYDNAVFWAKDNDVEDYAVQLLNILAHSSYADIAKKTIDGKEQLLNGELYACTQEQAAKKYEEIFNGKAISCEREQ